MHTMSAIGTAVRALAFDLDGTLVDSAPDIGHALNQALRESGFGSFELAQVRAWIGDGPDVLIDRALRALGQGAGAQLRSTLRQAFDRWRMARCSKAFLRCCRHWCPPGRWWW
jgi:phosphoglycolate phosphatase